MTTPIWNQTDGANNEPQSELNDINVRILAIELSLEKGNIPETKRNEIENDLLALRARREELEAGNSSAEKK